MSKHRINKRSSAARRGWETRRRRQRQRSAAAKRGWETRRKSSRRRRRKYLPPKPQDIEFNLCHKVDRRRLFSRIKRDYEADAKTYKSASKFRRVQVFIITGKNSPTEMKRTFRGDFAPLQRFLGLTGRKKENYPVWTPDKFCGHEKQVLIAEELGSGKIGTVLQQYNIAPPRESDEEVDK